MNYRVIGIFPAAMLVGFWSAYDCASSWNDASRLATVECLVDRQTWIIDDSVFVCPPPPVAGQPHPFGHRTADFPNGTLDKLFIDGHYYSDKSPLPAVMMASVYQMWRWLGGPSAVERPDSFCRLMTVATSGLAYSIAICCMVVLGQRIGLSPIANVICTIAFSFGTMAWTYVRAVNNHEMLLGVVAALLVAINARNACLIGAFAGLAYGIDSGAGPVIFAGAAGFVLAGMKGWRSFICFAVCAAGPIAIHHILNYHIGGTLRPANANPEYFTWPGCPFAATTISGAWNHESIASFAIYAVDLLVGKKGFWGHNLPLLIVLTGIPCLLQRDQPRRADVLLCMFWIVGVWLVYAAGSTNYSGQCVSIRWFVPLVTPIMWLAMIQLKQQPRLLVPMAGLTLLGVIEMQIAWLAGPWSGAMLFGFWAFGIAGIVVVFMAAKPQATHECESPSHRAAA